MKTRKPNTKGIFYIEERSERGQFERRNVGKELKMISDLSSQTYGVLLMVV